jgi:hypothetical protein
MPRCPFLVFALVASLLALCGSGCATIVKGTTQDIPIASEPSGARVAVDGKSSGSTPTKVTMDRKRSHMVTLELDGYETENIAVTNSIGGAVAGNIIAGGLVGWGVDAMTGAQYNLHPDTVTARLRPKTNGSVPGAPASAPSVAVTPAPANRTATLADELAKLDEMKAQGKVSDEEHGKLRASLLADYQAGTKPVEAAK